MSKETSTVSWGTKEEASEAEGAPAADGSELRKGPFLPFWQSRCQRETRTYPRAQRCNSTAAKHKLSLVFLPKFHDSCGIFLPDLLS